MAKRRTSKETKFLIAGLTWTLREMTKAEVKKLDQKDRSCLGMTFMESRTILLRPGMDKDMSRMVLLHEIIHAISGSHPECPAVERLAPDEFAVSLLTNELHGVYKQLAM